MPMKPADQLKGCLTLAVALWTCLTLGFGIAIGVLLHYYFA